MKKFIPLIIFMILSCLGSFTKQQLFSMTPNIFSERNLNYCMQYLLWLPIGLFGGSVLLLIPRNFLNWLSEILTAIANDQMQISPKPLRLFNLRLSGIFLLAGTLLATFSLSTRNACGIALGLVY